MIRLMMLLIFIISLWTNHIIADTTVNSANIPEAVFEARARKVPIMLVFVDDECEKCSEIDVEFIKPMIISGDYEDMIRIVYVNMEDDTVKGFTNEKIPTEDMASRFSIEILPTVAFVDSNGISLVEPISGVSNLEYYGSLLDEAIEIAVKKLRNSQ